MADIQKRVERHFAGKARASNFGCERVNELDYDIMGNVHNDMPFGKDCFEHLPDNFERIPELGVAVPPRSTASDLMSGE